MVYDRGAGSAAYDGLDVIAGQQGMLWNGAPRFVVGASARNAGYDANGNMTSRIEEGEAQLLIYDQENRLVQVRRGDDTVIAIFTYDGDGQRVKATVNGTTTVYVGNYYEQGGAPSASTTTSTAAASPCGWAKAHGTSCSPTT